MVKSGRGWGKTRTGAELVRDWVESGQMRTVALVNDTAADTRDIMIEGPSGLLAVCPPWNKPVYEPSKRRVVWPNGAMAIAYAAESPEMLRGPQHDGAWVDELFKWKNLRKRDTEGGTAWDNLLFGLRTGAHPRWIATTTPRPVPLLKQLQGRESVRVTGGSSYDNRVNLAEDWYREVIGRYEGTRLGRQEIYAEDLEDIEGALWRRDEIESKRVEKAPDLVRVVVAIDPSTTGNESSDEAGIVVAGIGKDGHGYILDDVSLRATPDGWARRAVVSYHAHKSDRIVAETNNGGDMVELTLRMVDPNIPYRKLTASRGKQTRAEPVAALYEQGRVHHVGTFPMLEDEMCSWVPGDDSPNRMDALVWALTELMVTNTRATVRIY